MKSPWRNLESEQDRISPIDEGEEWEAEDPLAFFRGLLVALPLSALLWAAIIWLFLR